MCHVHERDADLALYSLELDLHRLAQFQVEGSERFVQQQGPRPVHQRPGERDPLLLAAGERPGPPVGEPGQLDELEHLADPPAQLLAADPAAPQPEGYIRGDIQVWEERVALEDEVHIAPIGRDGGDVAAVEQDAPAGRFLESGDHPQGGGLAAAGWAEQREELALLDAEIHPRDRAHQAGARAVFLRDTDELDGGCRGCGGYGGRGRGRGRIVVVGGRDHHRVGLATVHDFSVSSSVWTGSTALSAPGQRDSPIDVRQGIPL